MGFNLVFKGLSKNIKESADWKCEMGCTNDWFGLV
jgi:hypothetical protein